MHRQGGGLPDLEKEIRQLVIDIKATAAYRGLKPDDRRRADRILAKIAAKPLQAERYYLYASSTQSDRDHRQGGE